jgi:restriction system protein
MAHFWMVRAGEGGYLVSDFEKASHVAIGWDSAGDFTEVKTLDQMRRLLAKVYPDASPAALGNSAAMAFKFRQVMAPGDKVVTYDPGRREYLLGTIEGEYRYAPGVVPNYHHVRRVRWLGRVSRDALSTASKNTLGSTLTIFEPGEEVLQELEAALKKQTVAGVEKVAQVGGDGFELAREDASNRSHEFIKDRILKLSPDDMEGLTAAVLRAMGYKARVSPKGRDRGRDVVASRDGLGFEPPRIVAQVKHTKAATSGEDLRAFLGVLQPEDKALFVSTGGFSYDAKFEAERGRFPVTLVDLDELASLVAEYYENFDAEGRSLLPLIRIYWPA